MSNSELTNAVVSGSSGSNIEFERTAPSLREGVTYLGKVEASATPSPCRRSTRRYAVLAP